MAVHVRWDRSPEVPGEWLMLLGLWGCGTWRTLTAKKKKNQPKKDSFLLDGD